jgi:hypothetical protein
MTSSWDSSGPKRKVVDTHYHVGYFYGFLAAIAALGLLATFESGISYPHLAFFALASALAFGHFKVSEAAENDQGWVRVASMALGIPLLFGFPIGTFLGIKLLINAAQLKPGNA